MSGGLNELLSKDAKLRAEHDYELVFDDFFYDVGGRHLTDVIANSHKTKNADYVICGDDHNVLVELKQIRTNDFRKTFWFQLFSFMANKGGVSVGLKGTKYSIIGKAAIRDRWLTFYDQIRPSILKDLQQANKQLAASESQMAKLRLRCARGVMLFNTADYNLSTDLLRIIVESRLREAWKANHFRSIDFVIAGVVDLGRKGSHPQEAFLIAKNTHDPIVEGAVQKLWKDWQLYVSREMGEAASARFAEECETESRDLASSFEGKLQRRK